MSASEGAGEVCIMSYDYLISNYDTHPLCAYIIYCNTIYKVSTISIIYRSELPIPFICFRLHSSLLDLRVPEPQTLKCSTYIALSIAEGELSRKAGEKYCLSLPYPVQPLHYELCDTFIHTLTHSTACHQ